MTDVLRLSGLHYGYDAQRRVLTGADLTVKAGERVGLVGANGAGKTTLFHLMVGLIRPSAGTVWAFGRERRTEADFHDLRVRTGLLFQDPDDQLFCPTVGEDVAFGPLNLGKSRAEVKRVVHDTLDSLGLAGFADRVTHKLSGGEKRLVSLATVLAMQPDILLLDEPTNALDNPTEQRLLDILLALPQAMVVISHDRAFLDRLSTRQVRLAGGALADVER